ncbi:MAG: hypothetical protein ACJ06V_07480, partial [Verrucomicrobiota bacterium]
AANTDDPFEIFLVHHPILAELNAYYENDFVELCTFGVLPLITLYRFQPLFGGVKCRAIFGRFLTMKPF